MNDGFYDLFDAEASIFTLPHSQLTELLDAKDYAAFHRQFSQLNEPIDIDDFYRLVLHATQAPLDVIQQLVDHVHGTALTEVISSVIEEIMEAQRVDILDLFLTAMWSSPVQDSNNPRLFRKFQISLRHAMDTAISCGALPCVERLLQESYPWKLTETIQHHWAKLHSGNVALDACIRAIVPYFMDETLQPDQETPFHPALTWSHTCSPGTDALTAHLLETAPFSAKKLIHFYEEASTPFSAKKLIHFYEEASTPFSDATCDEAWTFPALEARMDMLIRHRPELLKTRNARCLLAYLALQDNPTETTLYWAQHLGGKQLRLDALPYLFWDKLLGDAFTTLWKSRFPPALKPTTDRHLYPCVDDWSVFFDCRPWLKACQITGSITEPYMSNLAYNILLLPPTDPYFLQALQPGGVLYDESAQLLNELHTSSNMKIDLNQRLVILTHLKGGKTYDL